MNESKLREEFYNKFLPEGETEAEPIADFIDGNLITARQLSDWWLSKFSSTLDSLEKEVEGMRKKEHFGTGEVRTNTDYQRLGEHEGYNHALSAVLSKLKSIREINS